MPSRPPPSPPPPPPPAQPQQPQPLSTAAQPLLHHHNNHQILLIGSLSVSLVLLSLLALLSFLHLYRKLSFHRTTPFPHHHHNGRRFSYSLLRRATNSFSPSTKLGHGGFGSVHKATLPSGETVALKLMDSPGSLQGEREFHNELSLCSNLNSPFILSLLGFSSDRRNRKLILVYELMKNRSLQDALLDRKCPELMNWKTRFDVIVSVAKGLEYLHHCCEPPVIHGDIKPSNILLDCEFKAKIGDFGLARVKEEVGVVVVEEEEGGCGGEECDRGSVVEEVESVATGTTVGFDVERSPESFAVGRALDSDASPEMMTSATAASPEVMVDKGSVLSDGCFDGVSVESGNQRRKGCAAGGGGSGRDWWWKQDNGGGSSESGRVKDYVMEWIGSEIKKERPKSEWVASPSGNGSDAEKLERNNNSNNNNSKKKKKKQRKRLDWWASLDDEKLKEEQQKKKKEKNRKPREWWKEEFCEELAKKSKKKKRSIDGVVAGGGESWWQKDEDLVVVQDQKRKRKSKSSRGSIDWWLDGLSGELRSNHNGRRNSQDWVSGDIPKSGGISSTPSMRGTVCYIAPEYGGGGQLSEKCDVYSFGVLLLVLVAGRRPLQVTASPMSEFERANLISWARQLAHNGRLLDLVDPAIHSLDKEQALLCITIALLCLQRSPMKRPSMKEIVGMLSGEAETPHLPFEFSPSPPSNFLFKSRKKAR